jgi:hypothetical protein
MTQSFSENNSSDLPRGLLSASSSKLSHVRHPKPNKKSEVCTLRKDLSISQSAENLASFADFGRVASLQSKPVLSLNMATRLLQESSLLVKVAVRFAVFGCCQDNFGVQDMPVRSVVTKGIFGGPPPALRMPKGKDCAPLLN